MPIQSQWRSNQRLFHRCTRAFITVINSLNSPDNMLTNNALYPCVGKGKLASSSNIILIGAQCKVHNLCCLASTPQSIQSPALGWNTKKRLQDPTEGGQAN